MSTCCPFTTVVFGAGRSTLMRAAGSRDWAEATGAASETPAKASVTTRNANRYTAVLLACLPHVIFEAPPIYWLAVEVWSQPDHASSERTALARSAVRLGEAAQERARSH